jgi:hypothetical protein
MEEKRRGGPAATGKMVNQSYLKIRDVDSHVPQSTPRPGRPVPATALSTFVPAPPLLSSPPAELVALSRLDHIGLRVVGHSSSCSKFRR